MNTLPNHKDLTYIFKVEEMTCGTCVNHIESKLIKNKNVISVSVSLPTKTVVIKTLEQVDANELMTAISDAGYIAHLT